MKWPELRQIGLFSLRLSPGAFTRKLGARQATAYSRPSACTQTLHVSLGKASADIMSQIYADA